MILIVCDRDAKYKHIHMYMEIRFVLEKKHPALKHYKSMYFSPKGKLPLFHCSFPFELS